ncbi:MAG: M20 metallopeptidase family protein, partial [Negativibacillus sp.]
MNQLLQRAKELNPEIVSHRRRFHQNPELGLHLPKTSAYICEQLEKMGYQPQRIGDSSILAAVGNGDKTFLLRADMDALPIHEETGLPFSSCVEGCMHACGHDCHAAMLLGAAKLLKEQESCLQGKVWLFFQAGEEILDGAKEALDDGLLEKTHADAAMMIHILSGSPIPAGSICFPAQNGCYASADWYRIDVSGKGGHGAMPQNTISSVNTICAVNAGIQEIMSVGIEPAANAVMTVGELHAGFAGSGNIIPDSAYLAGTIRTFD